MYHNAPHGSQSIVVLGNAGAGNSTMLDSMLGERSVLPTDGMRACTTALVEVKYLPPCDGIDPYAGEVDFISEEEWDNSWTCSLPISPSSMTAEQSSTSLGPTTGGSWCKV